MSTIHIQQIQSEMTNKEYCYVSGLIGLGIYQQIKKGNIIILTNPVQSVTHRYV